MSTTFSLYARWKAAKGHSSDRKAMAELGVSHGAAVHWKAGRNADADVIERMAIDLGENAGALIAKAMAEQAKGAAAKTWARLAKQLSAAAVLVVATALPLLAQATPADNLNDGQARHYAKLRALARFMRGRWLRTTGTRHGPTPVLA